MNWTVFLTTFTTIFVAEFADKTQFAAFAISAQTRSSFSVMLGVVLALALAGILAVLAGRILNEFINITVMRYLSGAIFIMMGGLCLWRAT